jgi:predicted PurR-regulated permease PerM
VVLCLLLLLCASVVREYSEGVREAPLVVFAVAVALAFEENNFVKFFKLFRYCTSFSLSLSLTLTSLLRSATFLNACIMHRYLPVVWTQALKVLNRSHSMQKRITPFPLKVLTRMLALGNQEQVSHLMSK